MPSKDSEITFEDMDHGIEMGVSQEAIVILSQKFNDNHIDKFLEMVQNSERLNHRKLTHQRIMGIFILLIFIGFFIFLTLFLARSFQVIYLELIKLFLAFFAGFGGGYGLKSWKNGN